MKKIISVLLTGAMLLGATASVPLSASAVTTNIVESGATYADEYGSWTYELVDYGKSCLITGYDKSMPDIEIPSSINGLPVVALNGTFEYCSELTSVTIPNSVTYIGERTFAYCESLTSVTMSDNVTIIDALAFYGCDSLINITMPDKLTTIGKYAFGECDSLTTIAIPKDVTTIDDNAFDYCNSLTDIEVSKDNAIYSSIDGVLLNKKQSELICYPNGKTSDSYTIPDGVTTIGYCAFASCRNLTSITIPNGVTTIGNNAFFDCSNLTRVTIPNSVTTIDRNAFYNCSSLTSITIPNGVTTIGEGAFCACGSLTSVEIPNSVTAIGEGVFSLCGGLTSVTIPNSVTIIDDSAFRFCDNICDVYYTGTESEWNGVSIGDDNGSLANATVHYNYVPPVRGDVNGDGEISIVDVIYVLKYTIDDSELTAEKLAVADLNGDKEITVLDAILMQKIILQ